MYRRGKKSTIVTFIMCSSCNNVEVFFHFILQTETQKREMYPVKKRNPKSLTISTYKGLHQTQRFDKALILFFNRSVESKV